MLLHDAFERTAQAVAAKTALVDGARRVAYGDLLRQARALANALRRDGIEAGDRVLVFLESSIEYAVAVHAGLMARRRDRADSPAGQGGAARLHRGRHAGQGARDAGAAGPGVGQCRAGSSAPCQRPRCRLARRQCSAPRGTLAGRRCSGAARVVSMHRPGSGGHHLHVRHDGHAEGRDAHAPEHGQRLGLGAGLPGPARVGRHRTGAAAGVQLRPVLPADGPRTRRDRGAGAARRVPAEAARIAGTRTGDGVPRRADPVRCDARRERSVAFRPRFAPPADQRRRRAAGASSAAAVRRVSPGAAVLDVRNDRVQAHHLPAAG